MVCYVPATNAAKTKFFLLQPFTVLMRQTRQAVRAIKRSISLDVYGPPVLEKGLYLKILIFFKIFESIDSFNFFRTFSVKFFGEILKPLFNQITVGFVLNDEDAGKEEQHCQDPSG
jgi:hypothetical protein